MLTFSTITALVPVVVIVAQVIVLPTQGRHVLPFYPLWLASSVVAVVVVLAVVAFVDVFDTGADWT